MKGARRLMVAGLITLTAGSTACGGGQAAITIDASSQLSQRAAAVRSAATSGNRAEAMAQLAQLQALVATLMAGHQISAQRADEILRAATSVNVELAKLPSPTPTPSVDTSPSSGDETPVTPPGKKKHGND